MANLIKIKILIVGSLIEICLQQNIKFINRKPERQIPTDLMLVAPE